MTTTRKRKKPTAAVVRRAVHQRTHAAARPKPGRPVLERTDAALELLAQRLVALEAEVRRLQQLAMHAVEGQAVDVAPVTG